MSEPSSADGRPCGGKGQGFFPSALGVWGWIILYLGGRGCIISCRMFSSIPGLYPLDASSIPPPSSRDNQMSPDIAKCTLRAKIAPG